MVGAGADVFEVADYAVVDYGFGGGGGEKEGSAEREDGGGGGLHGLI